MTPRSEPLGRPRARRLPPAGRFRFRRRTFPRLGPLRAARVRRRRVAGHDSAGRRGARRARRRAPRARKRPRHEAPGPWPPAPGPRARPPLGALAALAVRARRRPTRSIGSAATTRWSTRGGRIESPVRSGELKKQLRMVAEGSVLVGGDALRGAAPDVAPDGFPHPVYRAGFALSIPVPAQVIAMRYRLTCLTPLLVGDGRKLSPIDYMVWKDQVNVLDQRRIFRLLAKGPRLDGYLTQLKRADKLDFASWGGFAQNFADRRIPFESPAYSAILEPRRGRHACTSRPSPPAPPARTFPAAAIKGALRTGLLFANWKDGMLKEVAATIQERTAAAPSGRERGRPGARARRRLPDALRRRGRFATRSTPRSFKIYLLRVSTLAAARRRVRAGLETKPARRRGRRASGRQHARSSRKWPRPGRSSKATGRRRRSSAAGGAPPGALAGGLRPRAHVRGRQRLRRAAAGPAEAVRRLGRPGPAGAPARRSRGAPGRSPAKRASACWRSAGAAACWARAPGSIRPTPTTAQILHGHFALTARRSTSNLPFPKTRRIVFLNNRPATLPGWAVLGIG